MDYEHPFVQEVRANPDDDAPRLIFADYLEETGDPQAELIRLQVELSHLSAGDPARRELELRENELLDEFAEAWLEPLRELGAEGVSRRCFQRGLIERVRISADAFLRDGVELCRRAPALHCVELRAAGGKLESLAALDWPEQVTGLDLRCNAFKPADLAALVQLPPRERVRDLSLAVCSLRDAAVQTLTTVDWPQLRRLDLSVNKLESAAAKALARCGRLPQLRSLLLSVNRLGNEGLQHLGADSPLVRSLRELDVGSNRITDRGLGQFIQLPLLAVLENFVYRGNKMEIAQSALIARAATALQRIDLRGAYALPTTHYGYGSAKVDSPDELAAKLGENLLW